jgi:hypothetical protein
VSASESSPALHATIEEEEEEEEEERRRRRLREALAWLRTVVAQCVVLPVQHMFCVQTTCCIHLHHCYRLRTPHQVTINAP